MKKTSVKTVLLLGAAVAFGACSSPTSSTTLDVTLTADPDPITAEPSTGVTYTVTNPDSTVSTYTYPWKGSFVLTIQETGGLAVDITAVSIKVQQASGGIVITPTGGEKEYFKFNSSASGNHIAAKGSATIGFDIWYALPNTQKEALVTVGLNFMDADNNTYTKAAQVKVAP